MTLLRAARFSESSRVEKKRKYLLRTFPVRSTVDCSVKVSGLVVKSQRVLCYH